MERADASRVGFAKLSKDSLSDRAYEAIRLALMQSRLRPGERLLLRPLSQQLGLSATPVREALLRLVSEQALVLDERGTAMVPVLDRATLLEIRDLRVDLEGRTAARAALVATQDEIDELRRVHDELVEATERQAFARAIELNETFHFRLCALGRSRLAYQFVATLWMRCGPILSHLYDNGVMAWDVHPHLRVLAALADRDPEAARRAIADDILRGGQELLDHVENAERAVSPAADARPR